MNDNIRNVLENPFGFPSLSEILFPGDRTLLVPDAVVAGEADKLAEIVEVLKKVGVAAQDISILLTEAEENKSAKRLKKRLDGKINISIHRPSRRENLALLGVDKNDLPIALCRDLIDADMIITVGEHSKRTKKNDFGLHEIIFPRFSEQETQNRFAAAKGTERRKLKDEVDYVAEQLGIFFTVQLVKRQDETYEVFAGNPRLVTERIASKYPSAGGRNP